MSRSIRVLRLLCLAPLIACSQPPAELPEARACTLTSECYHGESCVRGLCASPSCGDGLNNGNETDVDCGGDCPACADGNACDEARDCTSGVCANRICQGVSCENGKKDGDETDVDCGGACHKCVNGLACSAAADCASANCVSQRCASVPTCNDGLKNGAETDLDCGGGTCIGCFVGKSCLASSDCTSNNCVQNRCEAELGQCVNQSKDADETDVDCGGSKCARCPAGKGCIDGTDCTSGTCVSDRCG